MPCWPAPGRIDQWRASGSTRVVAVPVAHCEVIGHAITRNPEANKGGWSVLLPPSGFAKRYFV